MKRILTVFRYMLLRNLRDRSSLIEMMIFPIILILILGTALQPVFEIDNIATISIGYLNQDQGPLGGYLDEFLASKDIASILQTQPITSREEGLQLLKSGEISALLQVEEDFSQRAHAGEATVLLTGRPGFYIQLSAVENIVEGFIHGANTVEALQRMGASEATFVYATGSIQDLPIAASGLMPGAMDYYAVTMLVMIIMYGAMYAAFGMGSYVDAIGRRVKASPIRPGELYLGIILANVITVLAQALLIIAFTRYVYGVNWGSNLPMLALLITLMVFLAIGLGTMLTMVTKSENLASKVLNALIPAATFVAGGYIKISFSGKVMPLLQHLSPNYLGQTAIFNTIYGGPPGQTYILMGLMALIIISCFAAASLAGRRMA